MPTDIPAQGLGPALQEFAQSRALQLLYFSGLVKGLNTGGATGELTADEALTRLLSGTGLTYRYVGDTAITILPMASEPEGGGPPDEPAPTSPPAQLEEVVVTGTNIAGEAPVGSSVISVTRAQFEREGMSSAQDVIRSLPQNSQLGATELRTVGISTSSALQNASRNVGGGVGVNLRGLGSDATLVLLNGKRRAGGAYGALVDVSTIPLSALARVEVLTDGASAIYGTDAVAGVVNFILRKDFEGFETTARFSDGDGFDVARISQLAGYTWPTGHAFMAYEFTRRENLSIADRPFIRTDLSAWGGRNYGTSFDNPGTLSAGGSTYALPRGQNGVGIAPDSLVRGTSNVADIAASGMDIMPAQRAHSLLATASQRVSDSVELYLEGTYSYRETDTLLTPHFGTFNVPRTNPFFVSPVPGAANVVVNYSFVDDYGPIVSEVSEDNVSLVLGAQADLPGGWSLDAYGLVARDRNDNYVSNFPNTVLANAALADTNPAAALNLFGDGTHTNRATLDAIGTAYQRTGIETEGAVLRAVAAGALFNLPAGELKVALGAEHRWEKLFNEFHRQTTTLQPVVSAPLSLGRRASGVFAEAVAPVVSRESTSLLRGLAFSAAARYERYESNAGDTFNPKFGVQLQPAKGLTLRGTYGTSFKAPQLFDVNPDGMSVQGGAIPDPRSSSGLINALFMQGPNPDLRPEEAATWTAGFDFETAAVPGLRVSASYFDVRYKERIAPLTGIGAVLQQETVYSALINRTPSPELVAALLASPRYVGAAFAPGQVGVVVDARSRNLARLNVDGVDWSIRYRRGFSSGDLDLGVNGAYLASYDTQVTAASAIVGLLNTPFYPSKHRGRAFASWRSGAATLNASVSHTNAYRNQLVAPVESVDAFTTLDLTLRYDLSHLHSALGDTNLLLSAVNVTDEQPPYVNLSGGYDPMNASPIGRLLSVELRHFW